MFLHRLGRDLGIADIDGLARSLGSRAVNDWMAFYLWEEEQRKQAEIAADVGRVGR